MLLEREHTRSTEFLPFITAGWIDDICAGLDLTETWAELSTCGERLLACQVSVYYAPRHVLYEVAERVETIARLLPLDLDIEARTHAWLGDKDRGVELSILHPVGE